MRASVVIPVWNGASVLPECLDALYAHSGGAMQEVICVDNASHDESAALIAEHYPEARLIRQPVNLGFAGGVNAGMDVAQGDVFVLLNQDAVIHPGWLTTLINTLEENPEFGIAGCTVLGPDGTVQHAGAMITRPEAYGAHLVDVGDSQPRRVEYATGAALAIRRETWEIVGRLDDGYYPAYYEDSDYCYRARRKGIETVYVPEARITHLFSNREWLADPIQNAKNHHRARYRFVTKHFDSHELSEFFEAEHAAVEREHYLGHAVGRVIAARDTLGGLADILERRKADLDEVLPPHHRRQLQVGFDQVLHRSFSIAETLAPSRPVELFSDLAERQQDTIQRLQALMQQEHDLLTRIYFKPPSDDRPEPVLRRLFRLLVLRPISFLVGRDYLLLSQLNTVHVARMDQMNRLFQEQWNQVYLRLSLLEMLTDHDYR
jgi:GT2 family glycosyltransferase